MVLVVPPGEGSAMAEEEVVAAGPAERHDRQGYAVRDDDEADSLGDDPEISQPRRPKVRRRRSRPAPALRKGWFGNVNAGILGGLIMMVIAIVWFFGGLAFNILFFYPPILFIVGIAAFIKGILDNR
jgi:hypothetical protein